MNLVGRQEVVYQGVRIAYGRRTYRRSWGQPIEARTYTAEFCRDGKPQVVSLETRDPDEARDRAFDLAQSVAGGVYARPSSITITDLAREYLGYQKRQERARTTISKYEYALTTFVAWTDHHFNKPARRFGEDDFWAWQQSVRLAYDRKQAYDRAVLVKQLFKWAVLKAKLLPTNPLTGVTLNKPPPAPQPVFSPEQVGLLLDQADPFCKTIFATLAYAGLRFGELRDLRWGCVVVPAGEAGYLIIRAGGSLGQTKTGTVRQIPIHPDLRPLLLSLRRADTAQDDYVFHAPRSRRNVDGTVQLNQSSTLCRLKQLCRECGLSNPEQYKLHTFRHTFASMLARNRTPIQYAQHLMGHRNSGILQIYYHAYDDVATEAIGLIRYGSSRSTKGGTGVTA